MRYGDPPFRCHLTPFFEDIRLDQIKLEMLARFIATLSKKKGLSQKRIKNIVATLRKILATAVDWEVLPVLPKFPKIKTIVGSFDFFVRAESDRCIAEARDPEEECLLTFPFHSGGRAGEQLAFRWTDIDWIKARARLPAVVHGRHRRTDEEREGATGSHDEPS